MQAGAGEPAKTGPERAGPRTPLETEPWTETTADLTNVLKRGAGMAAIGLVIVQIVAVAQTLVLGRLLGPHEVGVFTAGTVLTGLMAVFAQGTLSHALIQREHDIEDAANTVLIVTFVTGLLLALGNLVASPLIGALFHDSRVGLIAAANSGIILLHSCSSVPDALMQRTFQFKRRVIIDPAVALTFASVSIVFAVFGYGAWAMVIGTYASTTTWVLLSWWLAKWRPFRGRFSFRIWRELAGFSLPLLIDGIAERSRDVGRAGARRPCVRNRWLGPIPVRLPDCVTARASGHTNLWVRAVPRLLADLRRRHPVPSSLPAGARLDLVGRPSGRSPVARDGSASGGAAARREMARRRRRRLRDGGNRAGFGALFSSRGGGQGCRPVKTAELADSDHSWDSACHLSCCCYLSVSSGSASQSPSPTWSPASSASCSPARWSVSRSATRLLA